jgi:hypothetical protein
MIVEEQVLHDQVVLGVAETRFSFDDWSVVANTLSDTDDIIPDIVAEHSRQVVAIGEVETFDTVSEERALYWKSLGQSCPRFYIFIPEGSEKEAIKLISKHKIECAGLRSYRLNGHLEIRSIHLDDVICREDDHPWWQAIGSCD